MSCLIDKKTADLYCKLNGFRRLVNQTSGLIRWALNRVEKPYVACSFGKDSAVMLHLVLQFNSQIPVRFVRWKNETDFIDNYDDVIGKWGDINLTQIELQRTSLSDKRKNRFDSLLYDSYFVGLRQSESVSRRITLKKHGMFYKNKDGITRICPLSEWSDKDVAAYVFSNDLPVLNSYLKHGMQTRTASRIPREDNGIRFSFLNDLKKRDFQSYQKLIKNFPELIG